jgi:L-fuculose-phosphate aldolase
VEEKHALAACLQALGASGLSPGASGNASVRCAGGMWISASGIAAEDSTAENLVFVAEGNLPSTGGLKASSEWLMHQQIYADHPDTAAIVHCHSRYATAIACQRRPIPSFHYMVAVAGGDDIPCADYAEFGTQSLADSVSAALHDRHACLMANHGQIALGSTPARALALAKDVEELAAMYHATLINGGPTLLNDEEMATVIKRFAHYGQPR